MKKNFKTFCERLSRISRQVDQKGTKNSKIEFYVQRLRQRGFVILDDFVDDHEFKNLQQKLDRKIEQDFDLEFPCLAQSKIDEKRDYDLISRNFLVGKEELSKRGLTFSRDEIQSYRQMMDNFKPSTLTIPMPSEDAFYDLWLNPTVTAIVSNYMGFYPHLTEAYIRRNFPCAFPVMNHYWHRDTNHQSHLLKAFMFFTDCDIDTGAHHYISGSVNDTRFRDKIYFTDDEINSEWPPGSDDHIISKVKAGTIIIEDTRGLHKAGIPKKDYRDLGFAVFLPPNMLRKSKQFYQIEKSVFDQLTPEQKMFIPSSNIVNG